jgi:hypothetical protein
MIIIDDEEQGENKNDDELDLLAMDDAGGDDLVSHFSSSRTLCGIPKK